MDSACVRPLAILGYAFHRDHTALVHRALLAAVRESVQRGSLSELSGSFAVAYAEQEELILVSDHMGTLPLYYGHDGQAWHASGDFWELVKRCGPSSASMLAALELLAFNYVLEERTLAVGIKEVPPASVVRLQPGQPPKITRYWRADYPDSPEGREAGFQLESAVDEFVTIVELLAARTAAAIEALGHNHVGLNLTAGRDSRLIAWMLASRGISFDAMTLPEGDEVATARAIAHALGMNHHIVTPWYEGGQPRSDVLDFLSPTTMHGIANGSMSALNAHTFDLYIAGHVGGAPAGTLHDARSLMAASWGPHALARLYLSKHTRTSADVLRIFLPARTKDLADLPFENLQRIVLQNVGRDSLSPELTTNFEQRQRRFTLRDYGALYHARSSILPLHDTAWIEYWLRQPRKWQVGTALYNRGMLQLFTGPWSSLAQFPYNGNRFQRSTHPTWNILKDVGHRFAGRIAPRHGAPADIFNPPPTDWAEVCGDLFQYHQINDVWGSLPMDTRRSLYTLGHFMRRFSDIAGNAEWSPEC